MQRPYKLNKYTTNGFIFYRMHGHQLKINKFKVQTLQNNNFKQILCK